VTEEDRTDAELLAASRRGDDAAFGALVRRHIRPATLLATRLLGDRSAAEDVVQDGFLVVYRQAHKFDAARPFAPWCLAIIRRLAVNRLARDHRRSRLLRLGSRFTGAADASRGDESRLVARLDAALATRALDTLPPMQRACFELVALQGLSNEEVAAMHGISESTVRQHVFRARAALRRVLNRSEGRKS
jgi:RNA polymerase sigma-70 factor (ECF subfamily)